MVSPLTLVSGGQTGVDRFALDWARDRQVAIAGLLPADGSAEDGPVWPGYGLQALPAGGYRERTRANVELAQATLVLSQSAPLKGGSLLTFEHARALGRPALHLHPGLPWQDTLRAATGLLQAAVLNVGGPRASGEVPPQDFVWAVLDAWRTHQGTRAIVRPAVIQALAASIAQFDALYRELAR